MNRWRKTTEGTAGASLLCAGLAVCVAAAFAVVTVSAGLANDARGWLHFGFGGVRRSPTEVLAIALHNARFPAGALVCAALAPRAPRWLRISVTALLAALLVFNVALFGVAVGAYGRRLLAATALHAPLELGALSLAGGTYIRSVKRPLPIRMLIGVATVSVLLLLAGASLETFVELGDAGQ